VAVTLSDEVIAQNLRNWHAQKREKAEADAAQYAADLQAKAAAEKVTQGHNAKLTTERAKTTKATKNASTGKVSSRGRESGLMRCSSSSTATNPHQHSAPFSLSRFRSISD
jgi:hypothetical protein